MYTINLSDVPRFDLTNARTFIDFWSQLYRGDDTMALGTKEPIDYFAELNVASNLTEENVHRLLRWKDPHKLTHRILSGPNEGQNNPRVARVLGSLDILNQFRNFRISEAEVKRAVEQVFQSGIVWNAFLLHIAKPHVYPIADQNVFRAWKHHMGAKDEQTWQTYSQYCDYCGQIAKAAGVDRTMTVETIHKLKRIDDALFVFGQFLRDYYEPFVATGV